jgi:hypothetical protein
VALASAGATFMLLPGGCHIRQAHSPVGLHEPPWRMDVGRGENDAVPSVCSFSIPAFVRCSSAETTYDTGSFSESPRLPPSGLGSAEAGKALAQHGWQAHQASTATRRLREAWPAAQLRRSCGDVAYLRLHLISKRNKSSTRARVEAS